MQGDGQKMGTGMGTRRGEEGGHRGIGTGWVRGGGHKEMVREWMGTGVGAGK